MPRLIVSIEDRVIREDILSKERTTLGRRPYNDIVIDHRAVSGEHAVLHTGPDGVLLEDLGSTNGTLVNGLPVTRRLLQDHDAITIGKCQIHYRAEAGSSGLVPSHPPVIRIMSGPAAGRDVALVKPVTTIGKTGAVIASITRQPQGCLLAPLDGAPPASVNGAPVGRQPVALRHGDLIELAGIRLQFMQA